MIRSLQRELLAFATTGLLLASSGHAQQPASDRSQVFVQAFGGARQPVPLGPEFVVLHVTRIREGLFRRYDNQLVIQGRSGDRFRIAWRGTTPIFFEHDLNAGYVADYPEGQTVHDLSQSVTIALTRDGDHQLTFSQSGSGEGRTPRDYLPYAMTVRKLD